MDFENIKRKMIQDIKNITPMKIGSGGSEIIITCPRCGKQHLQAGPHFYIEADEPFRINCFHCPLSGVLTPNILHEIGISNIEYDEYLTRLHKSGGNNKVRTSQNGVVNYIIPTRYSSEDLIKISYSKERTGIDFENPDIIKSHKLIYNLRDFLNVNKLRIPSLNENVIDELSDHAIGFLSYNNNTINLRNVNSTKLKRYINLKIDKNISTPFLYIPPVNIDVLTENPMIVVAEGAYDILCIKQRFYPHDSTNIIFGATGSKGSYKSAIFKLLNLSCFFGANITIFSDTDADLTFYQNLFRNNIMKTNKIKIIYNKLHKDFGNINENYKFTTYILK